MLRAACLLSRGRGPAEARRVWGRALMVIPRVVGRGDVQGGRVHARAGRARRGVPERDEVRHRRAVGAIRVVLTGAWEVWDRLA